jgi:hypothetical protein
LHCLRFPHVFKVSMSAEANNEVLRQSCNFVKQVREDKICDCIVTVTFIYDYSISFLNVTVISYLTILCSA